MKYISYNRPAVVNYAQKWAFSRNPKYYNFDSVGGDCPVLLPNAFMQEAKK